MTPEQRLALYGGSLAAFGVLLILAAVFVAGREHRRQS
jgi:hypothetical protein